MKVLLVRNILFKLSCYSRTADKHLVCIYESYRGESCELIWSGLSGQVTNSEWMSTVTCISYLHHLSSMWKKWERKEVHQSLIAHANSFLVMAPQESRNWECPLELALTKLQTQFSPDYGTSQNGSGKSGTNHCICTGKVRKPRKMTLFTSLPCERC